jgi:proliferating cell nuclear antigen
MNESNNVLTIKTVQIQPIRNVIAALKETLTDATITFTKHGLKIINFDNSHTILVNVELNAKNFEFYHCEPDKIIVCVNTQQLSKVISSMSNDDTLTIYIDRVSYNGGIVTDLGFQYVNGNIKQSYDHKLRLMNTDVDEFGFPEKIDYPTIIRMPTTDFQKIVRDMNAISGRMEIKSVGSELVFSCEGAFAKCRVSRSESDNNLDFTKMAAASVVIQGEFSLKSLSHVTKCTPLCTHLELQLDNRLPLMVKYDVASLGHIQLCLAQLPPV